MVAEYRIARSWRLFIYVFAPLMAVFFLYLGLLPFVQHSSGHGGWALTLIALLMIMLSVGGIMDAYKSRLILDGNEIKQVGVLKEKVLPFEQVKGFSQDDKYLYLVPADDVFPKIRISSYTGHFDQLKAILAERFTDLDIEQYHQEETGLLENEALGITAEERELTVQKARTTARILNVLGFIDGIWLFFFPSPYELCIDVSILLVAGSFYVLHKYRAVIRIHEKPGSAYPNITSVLFFPSLCLLIRSLLDYNLLHYGGVIIISITGAILLTLLLWYCSESLGNRSMMLKTLYYLIIMGAFCYGTVVQINALQDKAPAKLYASRITGKHISRGKTSTYYLHLTPWGRQKKADDVEVSKALYKSTSVGETVWVHLKRGYLGIRWFYVTE